MKNLNKTFILFCLLGVYSYLSAQDQFSRFKNLTVDNGLSHSDVNCIFQDHEGFIWIGTYDGLNKYDGIDFTIYKSNNKDSTSLVGNNIQCIFEDSNQNLWIGMRNGLCRFNRDQNNFERINYYVNNNTNYLVDFPVTLIFEENPNNLWLGSPSGIFNFNYKDKTIATKFPGAFNNDISIPCTQILRDKKDAIWFTISDNDNGGLFKYDTLSKKIKRYSTESNKIKLADNYITTFMFDNNDQIWVCYEKFGIDVVSEESGTISRFRKKNEDDNTLNTNNIFDIAQDNQGKIFIGTDDGGLNIYDPLLKYFHHVTKSYSDQSILSNNVRKLYFSSDSTLWIGCKFGGVSIYNKKLEKFEHYKHDSNNPNTINDNLITSIKEDKNGNIWIATDGGGINLFNAKKQTFSSFQSDFKNPQSLTNNKVIALETDSKNGLWAGMWNGGLNYFEIQGENLVLKEKYKLLNNSDTLSYNVFKIYQDKKDELWVGTHNSGLHHFNSKTKQFEFVDLKDTAGIIMDWLIVRNIYRDSEDYLWIASELRGAICLDIKTGESTNYLNIPDDKSSIPSNSINTIYEDSKNRLWFGCDEGGLCLYNRKNKTFTTFSKEDGLPDNTIVGLLEDNSENIWASSNNGISKIKIDTVNGKVNITCKNYNKQDGLQDKIFNRWAYYKDSKGKMYFGGLNGFNAFYPDSIIENNLKPPVIITDFLLFNKKVEIGAKHSPLKKDISRTSKLTLTHKQSIFTFRFVALNYIFSEKNQFAYYMEGLEEDWNYVGNRREAIYTHLNPGEYTFRVKASNNDGIWNEEGASIKIKILPPWWKTILFKIIVIVAIVLVVVIVFRIRLQSIKQQKIELQKQINLQTIELIQKNKVLLEHKSQLESQNNQLDELNKSKDKLFSIIAHDLKNPIGTVLGFTSLLIEDDSDFSIKQQKEITKNIHDSTQKIFNLLENLLIWSRSQMNRINYSPSLYNITNQIYDVISLMNEFATVKKIKLTFLEKKEIIVFADMYMIETVLRNLITNAIKFSDENKDVKIEVIEEPDVTVCSVTDQGIGMTKEQIANLFKIDKVKSTEGTKGETGTGLGLSLCIDFIEKTGGKIWVKSSPQMGSTFYFSIPVKEIK